MRKDEIKQETLEEAFETSTPVFSCNQSLPFAITAFPTRDNP
jgi:hypothetical protein